MNSGASGADPPAALGLARHRAALAIHRARALADPEVAAFAICGSVARGDALPGSDLDLVVVLGDGAADRPFAAEETAGLHVETKSMTEASARARMDRNPMEIYAFLDGRAVDDACGAFAGLQADARRRFAALARSDIAAVLGWMAAIARKLRAGDDPFGAAYVAGASLWPLLDAVWAVNGKPTPPEGAVWAHPPDLDVAPPRAWLDELVIGDARVRSEAARRLADWVLERLQG